MKAYYLYKTSEQNGFTVQCRSPNCLFTTHENYKIDSMILNEALKFYNEAEAQHMKRSFEMAGMRYHVGTLRLNLEDEQHQYMIASDYGFYKNRVKSGEIAFIGSYLELKKIKSLIGQQGRNTHEYISWRKSVFERDGYSCKLCGESGVVLNAHHIKPFAKHKELRMDIDNGITLCEKCHKDIHKKHGRKCVIDIIDGRVVV